MYDGALAPIRLLLRPCTLRERRLACAAVLALGAITLAACGPSLNNEFALMQKEPVTGSLPANPPSGSGALAQQSGAGVRMPKSAQDIASASTPGAAAYKIGPADVLEFSVFKVPELGRTVLVDDTGTIDIPLLGGVQAAGKTARQLETELASKLGAKYLQSPQVTVYIKEYNNQRVTIEGAVKTPGVHSLKGKTTLMQLVAMSGGLDAGAADSTVVIFRTTNGQRQAAKFDLSEIRKGEGQDPTILPGDVVVANSSVVKAAWAEFLKALPIASFALLLL